MDYVNHSTRSQWPKKKLCFAFIISPLAELEVVYSVVHTVQHTKATTSAKDVGFPDSLQVAIKV